MKLTERKVAELSIPAGKSEQIVFDSDLPGFGVRLRAGGSRSWIVQYSVGARQRRVTFGKVGTLDADKARKMAKALLAEAHLGGDPQAKKLAARSEANVTLDKVVERFLARQEKRLKPRTFVEARRHLEIDFAPLHGQPIANIDRATVAMRLATLAEAKGASAADHARTALSGLYSWAIKEGIADRNPVAATNRPLQPKSRDRVLSDDEVREIWMACSDDDFGRIVRLLLLTAQRREEIAGLRVDEVDRDAALITLPASRTKNSRAHEVPLSVPALVLIPPAREGRELIFGRGENAYSGFSAAKKRLDARILKTRREADPEAGAMADWRLHDLRRTAATRMADLGVEPAHIEATLNHISGVRSGVAGIYNRSLYRKQKRDALTLWADHVMAIVTGAGRKIASLDAERRKREGAA